LADVVLLDADVLLDVLARREPFYACSAELLAACEGSRCYGLVSALTVTTLFDLLEKTRGAAVARTAIRDLLRILEVAPVGGAVLEEALATLGASSAALEDALVMAAAEAAGAGYIVTRAPARFAAGPVPALSPAEFLPLLDLR